MSKTGHRPNLCDVTLVAATSVAVPATISAIRASMAQADFGEVLLLTDKRPANLCPSINWRPIEPLASRREYSRFMLQGLPEHIRTSHALCIQWDGFVLNGSAWRSAFLEFDYIGAPWPHFSDGRNVGNGGFSLRSQRLLRASAKLRLGDSDLEDLVISRLCRSELEAEGIRFAPEQVARAFSYERMEPTGQEFGFHGAFNLVRHLAPAEAARLFRSLEPSLLGRNERWELLRWALARGRTALAFNMLRRLI